EEAGRFAGAIFAILLAVAGGLALLGVLAARPIVAFFVAGFLADAEAGLAVDRYELAVQAVRIIFPMTGILVLSAWSLGILNSHRRFFLPYVAPALWNMSMIAVLVFVGEPLLRSGSFGTAEMSRLLLAVCWGALLGGVLQFLVQLPTVLGLLRGFKVRLSTRVVGVRRALSAVGPALASRGVVQISGYLDQFLASFLAAGAVGALGYASRLYLLPIGLFAMSVAAAELPELSRMGGEDAESRVARASAGLRQMAFLTIPTGVGYFAFGLLLVSVIFQRGSVDAADTWLIFLVLSGYTLGLLPSTSSRLLVNVYYSMGDTATPARIAVFRLVTSASFGIGLMIWLDRLDLGQWLGEEAVGLRLGALGLALGSTVGAWVEWCLLYRSLRRRLAEMRLPLAAWGRMTGLALACAVVGLGVDHWLELSPHWLEAMIVLGLYAGTYLGVAGLLGFAEIKAWTSRSAA
ncbi:MAG: murein biosynthesis integral membrane protein MurJ, partial [Thermoanaerobaculia bacterium]|nr:murein biosynthesis integral membrane protein MurJ [Thermoanaerobaculia bacterium]